MTNPFVKLHVSILIAGFTGIFGKLITLQAGPLVWYRMLFTSVLFLAYLWLAKKMPRIPLREAVKIACIGAIVASHWVCFYGSIKYANVSIAVVCFALNGFFTAIFEPVANRKSVSVREICYSLITVCGIALIFHFDTQYRTGILLGVVSAALAALYTVGIRRIGKSHSATSIFLYQMTGGFTLLTLLAPAYLAVFPETVAAPSAMDLVYLLLLSSICTIGLFILQIQALQKISAFTVSLSYNLEPIYSIVLAMILFGEAKELGAAFVAGLVCIAISVCLQSLSAVRQMRAAPSA
ncbi:MAG: DMT family transporter [Deltaproteobacteria bacterium]|nr:DMT family transporter [Deltaproteobacteria bacterium]